MIQTILLLNFLFFVNYISNLFSCFRSDVIEQIFFDKIGIDDIVDDMLKVKSASININQVLVNVIGFMAFEKASQNIQSELLTKTESAIKGLSEDKK